MPIYYEQGSIDEPDNYRGITLLSCTCKLFTACLNSIDLCMLMTIYWVGNRRIQRGYSTIDHAFVLHLVIELYRSVRKRVFCAFIDYRKAFDSIDRSLLCRNYYHII